MDGFPTLVTLVPLCPVFVWPQSLRAHRASHMPTRVEGHCFRTPIANITIWLAFEILLLAFEILVLVLETLQVVLEFVDYFGADGVDRV